MAKITFRRVAFMNVQDLTMSIGYILAALMYGPLRCSFAVRPSLRSTPLASLCCASLAPCAVFCRVPLTPLRCARFFVGSFGFWPKLSHMECDARDEDCNEHYTRLDETWGAWLFLCGSLIYTVVPLIELGHQARELGESAHLEEAIDAEVCHKYAPPADRLPD